MNKIPHCVIEKLGYYVYLYINPFDNKIFYVGKGKGNRVLAHLDDSSETRRTEIIKSIRSLGEEPRIELLVHGLEKESDALLIETAAIDLIGIKTLSNEVRGYGSTSVGRAPLDQLIALYSNEPVEIEEPSLLIRINRLYRYDMNEEELYEATRGVWKVGMRRENVEYAFAVFRGIVREVYQIEKWVPAGSTQYNTDIHVEVNVPGRWEFVGAKANQFVRNKYLDKSVAHYFASNSQNPITYVNC